MQFVGRNMFRFEEEFVFQNVNVLNWDLSYCLFQPVIVFAVRIFLQNMMGSDYDYLPLIHPKGYPQSMLMDYKNTLGQGHTALYWTSPRRQYY